MEFLGLTRMAWIALHFPADSLGFPGVAWDSLVFTVGPWCSLKIPGMSWGSLVPPRVPWSFVGGSLEFPGLPGGSLECPPNIPPMMWNSLCSPIIPGRSLHDAGFPQNPSTSLGFPGAI